MGLNEFRKRTRLYKEVLAMPELSLILLILWAFYANRPNETIS